MTARPKRSLLELECADVRWMEISSVLKRELAPQTLLAEWRARA